MPVDAAHHRLLHHGGSSPFPSFCPRYTALAPVPMVNGHGGGGVVEAVSEESGGDGAPSPPPPVKPPRVETVVKVTSKGRTRVSVGERGNSYTPVVRPCAKLKDSGRPPVAYSRKVGRGGRGGARRGLRGHRYAPLGKEEDEDEEDSSPRSASRPNYGLLRAVTNRGRGYEDLRSRGATDEDLDSGDSSAASTSSPTPRQSGQSSPRDSSPTDPGGVGRGRRGSKELTGILITSALARSGIKRLSRVSFGSSKGSMVETLIYDSPVAEEERIPEEETQIPYRDPVAQKFGTETGAPQKPPSKVRVTFYECDKPLVVASPEPPDFETAFPLSPQELIMASPSVDSASSPAFDRQLSTDSGRDNPFRPDGDISKEADEIVELIKSGRPLSAAAKQQQDEIDAKDDLLPPADTAPPPDQLEPAAEPLISPVKDESTPLEASPISPSSPTSPEKAGANGSAAADGTTTPTPAAPVTPSTVEVTHATVKPSEAAHAEHVVIKKKNKCSCCVIQ